MSTVNILLPFTALFAAAATVFYVKFNVASHTSDFRLFHGNIVILSGRFASSRISPTGPKIDEWSAELSNEFL